MALVVVSLTAATICFAGHCAPALVGRDTPPGTYPLVQRMVEAPGYGGDVLQFKETAKDVYAIHRVWLLEPTQRRAEKLASGDPAVRRNVTGGCINVDPAFYDALQGATTLRIEP